MKLKRCKNVVGSGDESRRKRECTDGRTKKGEKKDQIEQAKNDTNKALSEKAVPRREVRSPEVQPAVHA